MGFVYLCYFVRYLDDVTWTNIFVCDEQGVAENEKNKKSKTSGEEGESKVVTENDKNNSNDKNREASGESSKENSKASEVQNQKPDYIHVRARRGQATDSHSLAERVSTKLLVIMPFSLWILLLVIDQTKFCFFFFLAGQKGEDQ